MKAACPPPETFMSLFLLSWHQPHWQRAQELLEYCSEGLAEWWRKDLPLKLTFTHKVRPLQVLINASTSQTHLGERPTDETKIELFGESHKLCFTKKQNETKQNFKEKKTVKTVIRVGGSLRFGACFAVSDTGCIESVHGIMKSGAPRGGWRKKTLDCYKMASKESRSKSHRTAYDLNGYVSCRIN